MRLIDADALSATMAKYIEENRNASDLFLNGCADGAYHYQFAVDHAQTIDERKTGKWEKDIYGNVVCSKCKRKPICGNLTAYCPHCGAKMEVDDEDSN